MTDTVAPARRLGQAIEILNPDVVRGQVRHVLFDFDGTLSLVREGWHDVMVPMMLEHLAEAATGESDEELRLTVLEYVTRLTGKQTIYQMIELADQIKKRGGTPLDPVAYKHEYLRRLESRIAHRIEGLENGTVDPESLLLPGSRAFLDELVGRGLTLYLASGTDEPFVLREARLLDVDRYFPNRIFGALDQHQNFSKKMVIDRILSEHGLRGPELLAVGDGYVEIENVKAVGGVALGVPCNESDPYTFDDWKRTRLALAGADVLVPNYLEHQAVLEYLFET